MNGHLSLGRLWSLPTARNRFGGVHGVRSLLSFFAVYRVTNVLFGLEIIFEANENDQHRPHEDPLILCGYNTHQGPKWIQLRLSDDWPKICSILPQPLILDLQCIETDTWILTEWPIEEHIVIWGAHEWDAFQTYARSFSLRFERGCSASSNSPPPGVLTLC